jgi:hypothetical protein
MALNEQKQCMNVAAASNKVFQLNKTQKKRQISDCPRQICDAVPTKKIVMVMEA